jgi:thioredoxin-related protein
MKRNAVYLFLCLAVIVLTDISTGFCTDAVKWYSYDEGMAMGKTQNKKVFLNFYADWCGYCRKMDSETFKDPQIVSILNKNFVPIKVNADKDTKLSSRYKVRGLPYNCFISESGEEISNYPGYVPADNLLPMLRFIQTDSYQKMSFKDFMKVK